MKSRATIPKVNPGAMLFIQFLMGWMLTERKHPQECQEECLRILLVTWVMEKVYIHNYQGEITVPVAFLRGHFLLA